MNPAQAGFIVCSASQFGVITGRPCWTSILTCWPASKPASSSPWLVGKYRDVVWEWLQPVQPEQYCGHWWRNHRRDFARDCARRNQPSAANRKQEMIRRLATVFLSTACIWLVACSIAWLGGSYAYVMFNRLNYSPGWNDVVAIVRIALLIASVFTLVTWIKVKNS
jgi:hypothetical protein